MKYGYLRRDTGFHPKNTGISADWNATLEAKQFLYMVRKGKCTLENARAYLGISERQVEVLLMLCEGDAHLIKYVTDVAKQRMVTLGEFDRLWYGI